MARWYRLFRQTTARYATLEAAIRDQIVDAAEAHGIDVNAEALTGERHGWLFDCRYEWEIQPQSDAYLLFERQYISVTWFAVFGLFLGVSLAGLVVPPPWNVAAVIGAGVLVAAVLRPFFYTSPVDATIATNEGLRTHAAAPVVLMVAAPLVPVTLFVGWLSLTSRPAFWPVAFLLAVALATLYVIHRHHSSLLAFQPENVPHVYELVGGSLSLILFGVMPTSGLIALQPQVPPRSLDGPLFYLPFVLFVVVVLGVMRGIIVRNRALSYYELREGRETIEQQSHRLAVLVLLAGAGYGVVLVLLFLLQTYAGRLAWHNLFLSAVVLAAVVPLLYVPTGVVIQTVAFVRDTVGRFVHSTPTTVETSVEIEPEIRELDTDRYIAGSYSLGIKQYIFVSHALVEELGQEELAAVLAHEDGHVKHGDALLSVLVPIAALFLVTGKNVLYAALDFRTREFKADTYAAEQVGEVPLEAALRTMASKTDDAGTASQFGAVPTVTAVAKRGDGDVIDRYFGALFGNFALTEAHPTVDERIERIRH